MNNKRRPGRPKVTDDDTVVSLLVTSFHSGMTVREACWQSGISHDAYYRRLQSDRQFSDTMARAQAMPTINSRKVIVEAINRGDMKAAKWWLERKARKEFGKQDNHMAVTEKEPTPSAEDIERGMQILHKQWEREYEKRKNK